MPTRNPSAVIRNPEIADLLKEACRRTEESRARMQATMKHLEDFPAYWVRMTAEIMQMQRTLANAGSRAEAQLFGA